MRYFLFLFLIVFLLGCQDQEYIDSSYPTTEPINDAPEEIPIINATVSNVPEPDLLHDNLSIGDTLSLNDSLSYGPEDVQVFMQKGDEDEAFKIS